MVTVPSPSSRAENPRRPRGARVTIERTTSRVLPVDDHGRILLLRGFEPARPHRLFWFTVGGAIAPHETPREAACRELREETGIVVTPDALGEPFGSSTVEFAWDGFRIVQDQVFFAVRVGDVPVSLDGLDAIEKATTTAYRWWYADELAASAELYDERLPGLMRHAADSLHRSGP